MSEDKASAHVNRAALAMLREYKAERDKGATHREANAQAIALLVKSSKAEGKA